MNLNNNLQAIQTLRKENYSYASIAQALDMNINTVKSICRRSGFIPHDIPRKTKAEKQNLHICKNCGTPIENPWNRAEKQFCSDKCRTIYWNNHRGEPTPGKAATSGNPAQKGLDSSAQES